MFDSILQRSHFSTMFNQWSEPKNEQVEEFFTPVKAIPSKPGRYEHDMPCKDLKSSFYQNLEDEEVWRGHTRIVMNLNHLINMPAGPGWTELHIQPSDTLQVRYFPTDTQDPNSWFDSNTFAFRIKGLNYELVSHQHHASACAQSKNDSPC